MRPEDRIYVEMRSYISQLIDGLNDILDKYKDLLTSKNAYIQTSYVVGILQTFRYTPSEIVKYYWNNLASLIETLKGIDGLKDKLEDEILPAYDKLQELKSELDVSRK